MIKPREGERWIQSKRGRETKVIVLVNFGFVREFLFVFGAWRVAILKILVLGVMCQVPGVRC